MIHIRGAAQLLLHAIIVHAFCKDCAYYYDDYHTVPGAVLPYFEVHGLSARSTAIINNESGCILAAIVKKYMVEYTILIRLNSNKG